MDHHVPQTREIFAVTQILFAVQLPLSGDTNQARVSMACA